MADYRLYCLDGSGRIARAEWLDAKSDDEAIVLVRAMKMPTGCEIWERDRLVAKVEPAPASAGDD